MVENRTVRIPVIGAMAALVVLSIGPDAGAETQYLAVFLADKKIGHVVSQRDGADGEVTTRERFHLTLDRMGASIAVSVGGKFVETTDGKPLRFEHTTKLGPLGPTSTVGRIRDGMILLAGAGAGRSVRYPEGALMPEAIRILQKSKGLSPGTRYTYRTFNPEDLGTSRTEVVVGEASSVALIGQVAHLTRMEVTETIKGRPFSSVVYVDEDLEAKKFQMSLMGLNLEIVACEESFALSPNDELDVLSAGTIASPVAIANPRQVKRATFTLAPTKKGIELDFPPTGSQRVKPGADGAATIETSLAEASRTPADAKPGDGPDRAALEANAYVQSDDPRIVRAAREIVGSSPDPAASARAIEAWVRKHISEKNLSVGYATAVQTLASRAGDCTEHAVLTAALCRAVGIPCRVVVGAAYVDEYNGLRRRFIGHAWNEAFVNHRWVTLDASLGADAARIAMAVGAGAPIDFVGMVNCLGNVKITAVKVE